MNNKKTVSIVLVLLLGVGGIFYILFVPDPVKTVDRYFSAWEDNEYELMYSLLTEESKGDLTFAEFKDLYDEFYDKFNITDKKIENLIITKDEISRGQAEYEVHLSSADFGKKVYNHKMTLKRTGLIDWEIVWNYNLVYPGLTKNDKFTRKRLIPERGEIFDRDGRPLAVKDEVVTVGVQPSRMEDRELLIDKLKKILKLKNSLISTSIDKYREHPDWFSPVKTLTMKKYRELEPELRPIPGVVFQKTEARIYPQGELAAHLTGYIGEVTDNWIKNHPDIDYRSGDIIGRSGIEKSFEKKLRGKTGYILLLKKEGGSQKVLMRKDSVRGEDISLTIDIDYQKRAYQALLEKTGAVVILDSKTDQVLALVSSPSFDPNLFSLGMSSNEWNKIKTDKDNPLLNRATQGLYAPGSVFKIITASAGLDTGEFTAETEFDDTGSLNVEGNIVQNYQGEIFAGHTFSDALVHSINTTFAKIGLKLGEGRLRNYAEEFGFGKKIDLALPISESSIGKINNRVDLAWTGLGQGKVLTTPFQMARVISTIARNGKKSSPAFIQKIDRRSKTIDQSLELQTQQVIKEKTALVIKDILKDVVEKGTGKKAKLDNIKIAGKTGTAEIDNKTEKTHAWFVGFAPLESLEISMAVFLKEGGVGGKDAAPIFKEIMRNREGE